MATVKRFHNYHIKSVKICLKEELFKNGTAFLQDRFHFLFQDAYSVPIHRHLSEQHFRYFLFSDYRMYSLTSAAGADCRGKAARCVYDRQGSDQHRHPQEAKVLLADGR